MYLRPSQPQVLDQIKYLIQVNMPRIKPNPATFTQVTTQQLTSLGVPVTTQQETNAVSSSVNVLAQVYHLTVDQVLKLLSGAHPSSLARVVTTPTPAATGTGTPITGTGTPVTGISTNPASTGMPSTASTVPPLMPITGEPTEAPEPGDPGFIEHYFRLGGNITAEHIMMLQEMAAV